jgi:hypothetical protein
MTPEKALESLLVQRIQSYNFESQRTQVVAQHQSEETATLPRIVVSCSLEEDATLAQAGVYPCACDVSIHMNAMDGSDLYLLDPLVEAVDSVLSDYASLCDYRVVCHGGILRSSSSSTEGDSFVRSSTATLWAGLI